ncbi:MAG TPA: COX15/CtaA family protein [Stellaceae bacterium]|nr:COX15/CtaA family protein [Stellaceae bacterium]
MLLSPAAAAVPRVRAEPSLAPVAAWLFCCCAMIYAMVVLGGITRLTQSGLSITEWEPVIGVVPPLSHAEWMAEFARYKAIPQYDAIHYGMTLAQFKWIFFWEYLHRLWGRLIGFVFALPFLYFLVRGRLPRRLVLPLFGILCLGGAQGALGWYMVESGLVHRISVSQYRLVAHLALALLIYAAILWVGLGIVRGPAPRTAPAAGWRRAAEALVLWVAATIAAGGFTAGLHAGLVYNTFPLMGGRLVPEGYARLHPFIRNWFENIAAVQFDHRLLAMTTVLGVVLVSAAGLRARLPKPAKWALSALLAVVLLQATLGISTLLLVVPVPLAVAHQAGAVLLLTAAIVFRHTLRPPRRAAVIDAPAALPI